MRARPRLFIAEPDAFDPEVEALLARDLEVVSVEATRAQLADAFEQFDGVWVRLRHRIDAELLAGTKACRVLACPATGLDHIDLHGCAAHGIRVLSLKGETEFLRDVRATAEHTIALTLSLLRKLPQASQSVLEGEWNRDRYRGRELHEKTIGLLGVGRLGRLVARMLRGFDAKVIGFDPRPDFPSDLVERRHSMDALLAEADIVSVHVNYDTTTHHLLGVAELAKLRRGAFLVNTSRGGVIDETALLDALTRESIAGAAIDVMEGEPELQLETNPLVRYAREHHNLLITPHIGGNTWESTRKTETFIATKVLAALQVPVVS